MDPAVMSVMRSGYRVVIAVRHGVETARVPGVAAREPTDGKPGTAQKSVLPVGLGPIGRTAWMEATGGRQQG